MPATGYPEERMPRPAEYRCNDGNIRKVSAARERVIERTDFARLNCRSPPPDNFPNSVAHRTKVHRHVRGICDKPPLAVKQRT